MRTTNALELRESSSGWTLEGHAATFDHSYRIGGDDGFDEVIRRGAFARTLSTDPRVSLLVNHGRAGSGLPLATTANGSLTLAEDDRGLRMSATLDPSDSDAQLVRTKVRAGLATEMSFAFRLFGSGGQRWSDDYRRRELLAIDLEGGDVSVCDRGANPNTDVDARGSDLADRIGLEVRGYARADIRAVRASSGRRRSTSTGSLPAFRGNEFELELMHLNYEHKRRLSERDLTEIRWRARSTARGSASLTEGQITRLLTSRSYADQQRGLEAVRGGGWRR